MPLGYTESEAAQHFGHTCRRAFAGNRWEDCEAPIRQTWMMLDATLPWESARIFIRAGWDAADTEQSNARMDVPPAASSSRTP